MLAELTRRYWTEASWALRLMLVSLIVFTASLFFRFREDGGSGSLSISANYDTVGTYFITYGGSGWDLHPHAYVVLVAAFLFFLTDFHRNSFWTNFGWWITAAAAFTCMFNGDNGLLPVWVAFAAVVGMAVAALLNLLDQRRAKAAAAAPAPPESPK